jgi:hypothetical protein
VEPMVTGTTRMRTCQGLRATACVLVAIVGGLLGGGLLGVGIAGGLLGSGSATRERHCQTKSEFPLFSTFTEYIVLTFQSLLPTGSSMPNTTIVIKAQEEEEETPLSEKEETPLSEIR